MRIKTDLGIINKDDWFSSSLRWHISVKSGEGTEKLNIETFKRIENKFPVRGANRIIGYTNKSNINPPTITIGRVGASGVVHLNEEPCWITDNSLIIYKFNDKVIDIKFLKYILEQLNLSQYSTSTAQPLITGETVKKRKIAYPDIQTQKNIVRYIEKKELDINFLLEKKQRLINLLEEQRQTIITEAVTKGLNPNVKMKDSGVEWIGEIPEHWELKKIKYCVDLKTVKAEDDSTIKYIGLENIQSKTGKYIETDNIEIEGSSIIFSKGDVLFGKLRPYLTKVFLADFKGRCSTEFLVMQSKRKILLPSFLKSILLTPKFIEEVNSSTYGAKMPRANWSFIGNIYIPIPNVEEQEEIIKFISEVERNFFNLVDKLQVQINKLKEYRQSLIYEAVTGKIDVRDMKVD